MGSIVLVCAVVMALGTGVAVAYGLCVALFGCFRLHAEWAKAGSMRVRVSEAQAVKS